MSLTKTTYSMINGATINILDFIPASEHAAIRSGTSTYDCLAAFVSAIASVSYPAVWGTPPYTGGPEIYIPPGTYNLSNTLVLNTKRVTLRGDGRGMYGDSCILKFPKDVLGIDIRYNSCILQGIALVAASGGSSVTAHGINMWARATIDRVYVEAFAGNGINIEATAPDGNSNCWYVTSVRVNDCKGHGFYVDGADVNAGVGIGIDSSNNKGWGIWDSSFLGNTYVGCHTASNTLGSYKSDNINARNMFLNCYSEGGQPDAQIASPSLIVGGLIEIGSSPAILGGTDKPVYIPNEAGIKNLSIGYGLAATSGTGLNFKDTSTTYSWSFSKAVGRWGYTWAGLGTPSMFMFYDKTATVANGYARDISSANSPTGGEGAIGIGAHYFGTPSQMQFRGLSSAAPVSGDWIKGDVIWNSAPASGGYIGWVCTASGSPGTWKTFGVIS